MEYNFECGTCRELRYIDNFKIARAGETLYIGTDKCKRCKGIKMNHKIRKLDYSKYRIKLKGGRIINAIGHDKKHIDKELIYLLRKIDIRDGNITDLDAFELTNHYCNIFNPFVKSNLSVELELTFYYEKLKEFVAKNKI